MCQAFVNLILISGTQLEPIALLGSGRRADGVLEFQEAQAQQPDHSVCNYLNFNVPPTVYQPLLT